MACVLVAVAIAALAGSGSLRADAPARIEAPGGQFRPAVAFGGNDSLTVWEDARPSSSISGTRVSPDGLVLDPQQIWIVEAPGIQGFPDVASDGQNYLAAWQDERVSGFREIYASRINYEGWFSTRMGSPSRQEAAVVSRPRLRMEATITSSSGSTPARSATFGGLG